MIHSHSTHGNTPSGPYDARQITLRSVSRLFCEPEARARSKRLIFIFIPLGNTYTGQVLLCVFTIHKCSGISGIKRPGLDQVPAHLFFLNDVSTRWGELWRLVLTCPAYQRKTAEPRKPFAVQCYMLTVFPKAWS